MLRLLGGELVKVVSPATSVRNGSRAAGQTAPSRMSANWRPAKFRLCEGFQMPAPARRRDRAWRPASENLRGRKPRGGWPRVRPGARYGDLAWRRSPRRRSAAGLDAARRGSNGCRAGKLAVPRGRPHALGRVGEPRSGSRARASPLRLDAPARPWSKIAKVPGAAVMTCRSGRRSGEPAGSRPDGTARR